MASNESIYQEWALIFKNHLGLNFNFALKLVWLWAYALWYRIPITFTSGFRDPAYQRELQRRWDAGDRAGLSVRPATTSKHSRTSLTGQPDAVAADIQSNSAQNLRDLGYLAETYCGLKWGGNFTTPDPVHFYV